MTTQSLILISLLAAATVFGDDAADIRKVLGTQQELWNAGDVRGFTAYYTEDTKFVSTQVMRGQQQVLERYLHRYPNRDAMGKLGFSDLEITKLGDDYASVIGRWKLDRSEKAGGDVGGYFTLLFKRTKQGWKIILDHTS
ncbi:MAG TPA: DUF4440 domain-containing protein [Bryobacteraceae bacterium]|jgi:uncharacterized protein (TIGR02246 family)